MTYYWIVTTNNSGNRVIVGPETSEYLATLRADKLQNPFDVVGLETSDINEASSQIKAMELQKTGDVDKASSRSILKLLKKHDKKD